jgi:hypothetical protein
MHYIQRVPYEQVLPRWSCLVSSIEVDNIDKDHLVL